VSTSEPLAPPRADLRTMPLDDGLSVYDPATATAFVLNGTAAAVWTRLDGRRSRDQIVDELAAEYATDAGTVCAQVDALLAQVQAQGLLRSAPT
jgi:Coenzyme PQQ synthesis protein D (PqqD)